MCKHPALVVAVCAAVVSSSSIATAQIGLKLANGGTTDPYIEAPYHKTLIPTTGYTIEAWITYDSSTLAAGTRWPCIARMNLAPNSESFTLRVDSGGNKNRFIKLAVRTTGGFQSAGYTFALGELKQWTHVAGTYDGQTIRFYVNAVLKGTNAFTTPAAVVNTGGKFRIGNGDTSTIGAETWHGEIDEVRLWPYARTAAEIASTMNLALQSVPGEVSTWNLDFTPRDTSGTNTAVDVNKPTYALNSLKLVSTKWTSVPYGTANAGCAGTPAIGATGPAAIGNSAYGFTCVHSANSSGGVGFVLIGTGKLTTPLPLGPASVWVNPTPSMLVPVSLSANGFARVAVPIPNNTSLPGAVLFVQEAFAQAGCSVQPFASAGMQVTVTK